MDTLTKPALTRLARRAGVKSVSDDSFETMRNIVKTDLEEIIKAVLAVSQTKTIMTNDVYEALHILGYNITFSEEL